MSQVQEIQFSNDLGNGSLKGIINGEFVEVPSCIATEHTLDVRNPIKSIDNPSGESYVNHYINHMDLSVQSPSITYSDRCLVGKAAMSSNLHLSEFDIASMRPKSDTDLAIILTLSTIAGKALEFYYRKHHKLPSQDISANVDMVTALPITEGKYPHTINNYERRYTQVPHTVVIRNFNNVITIHIHFNSVHVMFEGQAALYGIHFDNDNNLRRSIYQDYAKHYPDRAKSIHSYKQIIDENSVLGTDLGEGTTDLAAFNDDGSVNIHASKSIPYGFGHVMDSAIDELQATGHPYNNRSAIKRELNKDNTAFNIRKKESVINALNNQTWFVKKIGQAVSSTLRRTNGGIDLIYVYGGGSIPIEKSLREELEAVGKEYNDTPVIFINKDYAQIMNVLGLYEVQKKLMSMK